MTDHLAIHPSYPTRDAVLDGIAAARAALADRDAALALIADGLTRGALDDDEGARLFTDALQEV